MMPEVRSLMNVVGKCASNWCVAALLLVAAMLGTSPAKLSAADDGGTAARPNFVVILCDDLGYGDLGCFGHPSIKTPHLDQLAAEGIRFTDCYAASPVCSASRAGLMTGRTPSRVGVYDWIPPGHSMHLPANEVTIATLLKQAGYATCHVGKWHLNGKFNSSEQPQPGDHGFEHWMSTQNNAAPSHENPTNFVRNGQPIGPQQGYSCEVVVREAIDWLANGRDQSKPFFQFVCFHEPHEPIASPPDLVDSYPNATKRGEALYYANVTNMDRAVGRLLKALDEQKLSENTIVFFTSDNGPETLERYPNAWRSHGSPGGLRGMKLHVYEGGIRVPGILRWPKVVKAGRVESQPVCSLDLLPTFCSLAGAKTPPDRMLDGEDIGPLLRGEEFARKSPLYWHYFRALGRPKATMRDGAITMLGSYATDRPAGNEQAQYDSVKEAEFVEFEAYDLQADREQSRPLNLADHAALREKLIARHREVQAEGPSWKVPPAPQGRKKQAGKSQM